jgi:hypothetical protein
MTVTNTLSYYGTATITAVKCFIVQALGWKGQPVTNAIAYNAELLFAAVKSFKVSSQELVFFDECLLEN